VKLGAAEVKRQGTVIAKTLAALKEAGFPKD
jgi:hypothetical protein